MRSLVDVTRILCGITLLAVLTTATAQTSSSQSSTSRVDPASPVPSQGVGVSTSGGGGAGPVTVLPTSGATPSQGESAAVSSNNMLSRSSEILIGPGDLLEVSVYGAPDYTKQVRVGSDGEITLPMAGTLHVQGLTIAKAESLIAKCLSDGGFFNAPSVSVLAKELSTQAISVLGEVQKPGLYPLLGDRNLFDAISAAGGTTPRAGNTVSITHRADQGRPEIVKLSYGVTSSTPSNVRVYPGDTVVVSKAGIVYVVGDVHLPGGFIMENSRMTILQAVAMAQGANSTASLDKSKLIRKSSPDGQPQEIPISLKKILSAKVPDMNLQPDDIVFVPNSVAKTAGRKTLDVVIQTVSGMAIYGRHP
jgi:polysaccharide biosynthesis/export protein